jgi:hypothetical protein
MIVVSTFETVSVPMCVSITTIVKTITKPIHRVESIVEYVEYSSPDVGGGVEGAGGIQS